MDPVRTLIDRELLVSAHVHDLSGKLTSIQSGIEHAVEDHLLPASLEFDMVRVEELLKSVRDPAVAPPASVTFLGQTVRVRGPIEALERGLADLPHRQVVLESEGETLTWTIEGIPVEETSLTWVVATVRGWLGEGGPGLAGARMRIAARITGASYSFLPPKGAVEGNATLRLPRG